MTVITEDAPLPVQLYDDAAPSRGLVLLPFQAVGTSGFAINGGGNDGADGTRTNYFQILSASTTWANTQVHTVAFNGPSFGLRWNRSAVPIGIRIDGVAYDVPFSQRLNATTRAAASATARGENVMIAYDLGPGPHEAEIVLPCSVAVSRTFQLFGMIVEARSNPPPPTRGVNIIGAPVAITTSFVALNLATFSAIGFRALEFANTTGADRTINIRYNSTNGQFKALTVPANGYLTWTPPDPVYHPLEISADLAGVNCFPWIVN